MAMKWCIHWDVGHTTCGRKMTAPVFLHHLSNIWTMLSRVYLATQCCFEEKLCNFVTKKGYAKVF